MIWRKKWAKNWADTKYCSDACRDTAAAFARYAGMMAARFQGRVTHYITLNEPQCAIGLGYGNGQHAPGHKLPLPQLFFAWCNILRAHGLAMRAMQAADGTAQPARSRASARVVRSSRGVEVKVMEVAAGILQKV